VAIDEGLLHRVELTVLPQALHGEERLPVERRQEQDAGIHE
jgi:hypothetical protein